jgi:polysaccharide biosynthesis protein PslA
LFSMLKFRTMYHHMADRQASAQTAQGDRRVTNIGRILRKLSIDELPQLFNVLRGDMSLVGPRPHAPGTSINGVRLDDLVAGYTRRHLVRPGLTGLAQVNGSRGCMTRPEHAVQRLRYDLEYIEHWSFCLDIKIMFLTLVREIVSRNAF